MDYNIPYYSAYCRYIIVKRIMRLAGKAEPSVIEFAGNDHVMPPASAKSGVTRREMPPLGRPHIIQVS